jgi:RNA polymerase sigma-70 factor (ECF subfamily)
MNDDLRTIQRVMAGEIDAFRLLVERYERLVFMMIGNLIHDTADRDDAAQDTFLAAYRGLGSYDARTAKFSTWLLTIARNQCLNRLKKRKPLVGINVIPLVDSKNPAEPLVEKEFYAQLDRALAELPFEQKNAFVLLEIQGLSLEEASRIEAAAPGTLKSRLSRAKEKLRRRLSRDAE